MQIPCYADRVPGSAYLAASAQGSAAKTSASPPTLHQGPVESGAHGVQWVAGICSRRRLAARMLTSTPAPLTTFGGHEDHLQAPGMPGLRSARGRHGGGPPCAPGAKGDAAAPGGSNGGGSGSGGSRAGRVCPRGGRRQGRPGFQRRCGRALRPAKRSGRCCSVQGPRAGCFGGCTVGPNKITFTEHTAGSRAGRAKPSRAACMGRPSRITGSHRRLGLHSQHRLLWLLSKPAGRLGSR